MLAKAAGLGADEVVVDLEDSVAASAKEEARALVAELLARGGLDGPAVALRVNAVDSPWFADDVRALAGRGGRRGRVGSRAEGRAAGGRGSRGRAARLARAAAAHVRVQALVETAARAAARRRDRGVIASPRFLDHRLCRPGRLAGQAARLRPAGAVAARAGDGARGRPSVGAAGDRRALPGDPRRGRPPRAGGAGAGARGSTANGRCTPSSCRTINATFTPQAEEFDRASAIVAALEGAEEQDGRGAVELDGEMIDEASRKLALQTVARGRAAGLA